MGAIKTPYVGVMPEPCLVVMTMVESISTAASIILLVDGSFVVPPEMVAAVDAVQPNDSFTNAAQAFSMA